MNSDKQKQQNNKVKVNTITSPKDLKNRFCLNCHIKLIFDEGHNIYKCPRCNVSTILSNTEPDIKIRTTFPTFNPNEPSRQRHVIQSKHESLPRSQQFINSRLALKNKEEQNDPYLQMLKQKNEIRITNVEYYSHDDDDYLY